MPNTTAHPWRMFLPLGLVVLLALLWSIYWFVALGTAKSRFAEQRAIVAQQGFTLTCAQEGWGGYPFHLEYRCGSPVFNHAGKTEVRSANLLLVALAYAPWQVAVLLDGPSSIAGQDIAPTRIDHQRALAAITFGNEDQPSISAEIPAVSVPGIGQAEKLMLHSRPAAGGGTDVAASVTTFTYEPPSRPAVKVDEGSLKGTLTPAQSFTIDKFELQQGQLRYWGSGTLALDPSRRISGQIDTETNDIKALLGVVGPHLDLSDGQMANLRTMLGLLGNAAKASIIAKEGVLYLGPFKIAELKPLY